MSGSKKLGNAIKGLVLIAIIALIVLSHYGMSISRYTWAGAPTAVDIEASIISTWKEKPPLDESLNRGELGDKRGSVTGARVLDQSVMQARYGRKEDGTQVTYWPVQVTLETTYLRSSGFAILGNSKEKETVRESKSTCYVYQDDDGWHATFEGLTDETPFFKIW